MTTDIDIDTAYLLASMTPVTLVAMHTDALEAETPEVADAIRAALAALVGDDEAGARLDASELLARTPNDMAVDAFLRNISRAREIVAKIDEALDNHLDILPDDVDWGDVGTVGQVIEDLERTLAFITGSEE